MRFFYLIYIVALLGGCTPKIPDTIDVSVAKNGIIPLPTSMATRYVKAGFVKYTKVTAPNGKAIHILAQNDISIAQILRCRNVLRFYLAPVSGSKYGANKIAVANAMANNHAILMLLNGSDDGNPPMIDAQPLYKNEIVVEGDAWYLSNDYKHRDATFEEILHLVHDKGIGVDQEGVPSRHGVLPAYQQEIRKAQELAEQRDIWPMLYHPSVADWRRELKAENSLSQEYLAAVIDSYYGLWEPWEMSDKGMWGLYIAKTRKEIALKDPAGYHVVQQFFSPFINVNMDVDPGFTGIFNMNRDSSQAYTAKAQYLQHLSLTGDEVAGIYGNELDNTLNGNTNENWLKGGKGNDSIDGREGTDSVVFEGNDDEYPLRKEGEWVVVTDTHADRDGVDRLKNIEFLVFNNKKVVVAKISYKNEK